MSDLLGVLTITALEGTMYATFLAVESAQHLDYRTLPSWVFWVPQYNAVLGHHLTH